jgi:predicted oxidoreductase (fatty acid repression mutant protein)
MSTDILKMDERVSNKSKIATDSEMNTNLNSSPFLDAIKSRRSTYALSKSSPVSDEHIIYIVTEAIHHKPSTFNTQSTRLVVLFHKDHETFWSLVKECLKPLTRPENFPRTSMKMDNFAAGYSTILFYDDHEVVKKAEDTFSLYRERFETWSEHTSAMHQFVLWTALEAEGFGANLQHYNPVVDESAAKQWSIPGSWRLEAQIVFGGRIEGESPAEKQFKLVEGERLLVFGRPSQST